MTLIRPAGLRVPPSLRVARAQTFALRRGWAQWIWWGAAAVLLLALPYLIGAYTLHVINLGLIAVVAAIALNLLTGSARLVSLGQAALLGVGGFTAGLMNLKWEAPFLLVLLVATAMGALVGLLVGIPSLRLRVLYVAVTTLVLHVAVTLVLNVIQAVTLDSSGMIVPLAAIGPLTLSTPFRWYYLLLAVAALAVLFALNLLRSFVGRRWVAVADHDVAAEALGVSVTRAKLSAFVATSAMVSFAGALQGYYVGTVTYEYYDLGLAITYLAMIIIGGIGRVQGAVMGAMLITLLPYWVDKGMQAWGIGQGSSTLAGLHDVLFGTLIILFLLFEPRGLAEIWRRIKTASADWPFRYRSVQRARR